MVRNGLLRSNKRVESSTSNRIRRSIMSTKSNFFAAGSQARLFSSLAPLAYRGGRLAIVIAGLLATGQVMAQGAERVQLPADAQTKVVSNASEPLQDKVAIVTGGTRNLGRSIAVALATKGADVVIHYHLPADREDAEQTAKLVRAQGEQAVLVEGDLSNIANVRKLFDVAIKQLGSVDILINNAGWIIKKPVAEVSEAEWDRSFNINAKVPFFAMQEAAKRMRDNGRVINIGSSLQGSFTGNYSAYAAAKVTLDQTTRAFVHENGKRGITANVIAPGPLDTPFFWGQETQQSAQFATGLSAQKRLGTVDDIAPVVAFLATPEAQWVNGQTIFVNGGYLAR
jgi:NAD(P)-dependent dehydrogenase (short-subunit alcohol dehydrogenase family)